MGIDISALSPAERAALIARISELQDAVKTDKAAARAAKKACRISSVTGTCVTCGVPGGQLECGDFPGAGMVARLDMRARWAR